MIATGGRDGEELGARGFDEVQGMMGRGNHLCVLELLDERELSLLHARHLARPTTDVCLSGVMAYV